MQDFRQDLKNLAAYIQAGVEFAQHVDDVLSTWAYWEEEVKRLETDTSTPEKKLSDVSASVLCAGDVADEMRNRRG